MESQRHRYRSVGDPMRNPMNPWESLGRFERVQRGSQGILYSLNKDPSSFLSAPMGAPQDSLYTVGYYCSICLGPVGVVGGIEHNRTWLVQGP